MQMPLNTTYDYIMMTTRPKKMTNLWKIKLSILDFKGVELRSEEISVCHPLKGIKKVKDFVVRVVTRKTKTRVLKKVKVDRALKDTNGL